jgi:hypothetical protein
MAKGEQQPSGSGTLAGFGGQKRAGFAGLMGANTSYGSMSHTPGFAAAARAAEAVRDAQESTPVKSKKQPRDPQKGQGPSEGFKSIQVVESGPRRIEDTLRRGFVRNSSASLSISRPMNLLRTDKYAPSSGAAWRRFQERMAGLNGQAFRVFDLAEIALTYVSGEETMPLITARLQKMTTSRRGKDYKWEVGQVHCMVANLNDTLRREKMKELDAEFVFAQEYKEFAELAHERQLDQEHPRWLEMAMERAEDDNMPFLDQPLSRWTEGFFDVTEAYDGGKANTFSLVATDTLGTLKSGRSRFLDIMGDVCGLDVSMLGTDWTPTIAVMETYSGGSWGGNVKVPAIPTPMPLKAPQANNCEV